MTFRMDSRPKWTRVRAFTVLSTLYLLGSVMPGREEPIKLLTLASELAIDTDDKRSTRELGELIDIASQAMSRTNGYPEALYFWRRLHTDASVLRALGSPFKAEDSIGFLDRAIIVSGAAGNQRLELVQLLIATIQKKILGHNVASGPSLSSYARNDPSRALYGLPAAQNAVLCLPEPPSFVSFMTTWFKSPFILRGYAGDWAALNDRPWSSFEYLRHVAGPCRIVPVEVGADYRTDDWTQKLMGWDEFMTYLSGEGRSEVLYLAQHSLFMQFPALRDDIVVPDYVYCSPTAPEDYPDYIPPQNTDKVVLNAWLGPEGTISPAHTVWDSDFIPVSIRELTMSRRILTSISMVITIIQLN
jgi:hypothetical protein